MTIRNVNNYLAESEVQAKKAIDSLPLRFSDSGEVAAVHAELAVANAIMALAAAIRDS